MKYMIPPNYNEGKVKIAGIISFRMLIELIIAVGVVLVLENLVIPDFLKGIPKLVIMVVSALVVAAIAGFGVDGMPLSKVITNYLNFQAGKRKLSFRQIKKRVKASQASQRKLNELKEVHDKVNDIKEENYKTRILDQFRLDTIFRYNERYTQQKIPIKTIYNGMVQMKDDSFVKIIEIEAINFATKNANEKDALMAAFSGYNKVFDTQVHWKKMTFMSNANKHIKYIHNTIKESREENRKILTLADELCTFITNECSFNTFSHRFFLILRYRPNGALKSNELVEDAFEKLQYEAEQAERILARCGNKVIHHEDEYLFLYEYYYMFYNRKSYENEPFKERYRRVYKDVLKAKGLKNGAQIAIKPHNIIAPRGLDFSNKDYIIMDGMYYTYIAIDEFPTEVNGGWLTTLINYGSGYDFDIILRREDRERMLNLLSLSLSNKEGTIGSNLMPANSASRTQAINIYNWSKNMQNALSHGSDFFYFSLIVTVYSNRLDTLMKKKNNFLSYLKTNNFVGKHIKYNQEQAFMSTTPINNPDEKFFKEHRRNVLSDGAASLYPLTTATYNNEKGIPIGVNMQNNTPVTIDLYDPIMNILVFGTTGHGKSYFTKMLSLRLRILQVQVFVIVPSKGFEYRKVCDSLDGSFVEISPTSSSTINIMEIRPVNLVDDSLLDGSEETDSCLLNAKIQTVLQFIRLVTGEIDALVLQKIDPILVSIYEKKGITTDNSSIFVDNDQSKGLKEMPIIGDIYDALLNQKDEDLRRVALYLERFVSGSYRFFNQQTNVSLNNKYCVIDISNLDKDVLPMGLFMAQNFAWSIVKQGRKNKKAIIFEEMWKMMDIPISADMVKEVFKTIRGYRGIAVGIQQELRDCLSTEVGKSIYEQSLMKVLLYMDNASSSEEIAQLNLTNPEKFFLINADRGEALIMTKAEKFMTRIKATATEKELIESDGNELEKQIKIRSE